MNKQREVKGMEAQAGRIVQLLSAHGISSQVTAGVRAPTVTTFELWVPDTVRSSSVMRLTQDLARALGAVSCRVGQKRNKLTIEVANEGRGKVRLSKLTSDLAGQVPSYTAVLGMDLEGTPLLLKLGSPDTPHVLVAGTTGSGKTMLAQAMIVSLSLFNNVSDLNLVLIDPKHRGYKPFEPLPNLAYDGEIVYDATKAKQVLSKLVGLMEKRDQEGTSIPKVVVFIDELADLLQMEPEVEAPLTRLTQRGRAAGIVIVACTQKPTAAMVGSLAKSNFPVRLVGSVASPEDAKVASGMKQTGAEQLAGRGDFLLVMRGQVERFQGAFMTRAYVDEVVTALRGGPRDVVGAGETIEVAPATTKQSKRERVREMLLAGETPRHTEVEVFGYAGGHANRVVKEVIKEMELATT